MMSRRTFLKHSAVGVGAALQTSLPPQGANDRIRLGVIGLGGLGQHMLRSIFQFAEEQNVEVVAVCDVWNSTFNGVTINARQTGYDTSTIQQTDDYRRVLDRQDVDAVLIATPDFSHFQIASDALEAGKDIYLEKPMTYTLEEAEQLVERVQATDRIVQVGTQHGSEPGYRTAAEIVASGMLGKVSRIDISRSYNEQRWLIDYANVSPDDVNWPLFLTGLSDRPFDARLLRQWKLFRETCNGIAGIFLPHFIHVVHIVMGAAHPASVVAHGGVFVWDDGRENPDTFHALLEYDEGFMVNFSMGLGNSAGAVFSVYGTEGTLDLLNWRLTPAGGTGRSGLEEQAIESNLTTVEGPNPNSINLHAVHVVNWLDAVRSRQTPLAPVETGYQHMVASALAAEAYWSGEKQWFR